MTNPFDKFGSSGSGGFGDPMKIGEQRQIHIRDKPGGMVVKTLTLERTARSYTHDHCDAYNDGRHPPRWRVTDSGELAMVDAR